MWHPGLLLREAFRNLGPRHAVLAVVTAAMLAMCGVATVVSASSVLNQHDGELVRGGTVWWIQADSDGQPVPARLCAQLNGQPGVIGAGAVGQEQREWHAFSGARGVTVDVATPGIWAAWAVAEPPGEVVAGSDLADTGLAAVGTVLYDGEGNSHRIDARTSDSVKPARLLANVVMTRPPDFAMSECWVRMDPGAFEAGRDLLDFSFAGHGVAISPFAVDDSALLSPQEQWQRYAGLAPGLVAGVLIGLLVLLTHWGRRPELAVYRTFGSSRAELMFLTMGEVALVLVPSVILACAATVAALAVAVSQLAVPLTGVAATLGAGLLAIGGAAASGWALGVALVPLALRGGLHEQLKDR